VLCNVKEIICDFTVILHCVTVRILYDVTVRIYYDVTILVYDVTALVYDVIGLLTCITLIPQVSLFPPCRVFCPVLFASHPVLMLNTINIYKYIYLYIYIDIYYTTINI